MKKTSKGHRLRIQQDAADELDEIYRFIHQDSPSQARIFLKNLRAKILSLRNFPRRGSRARILEDEGSKNEIRFIEHKGYLIFYILEAKEVVVLHITGPGQNWTQLFVR